jgi:FAD binding domain
MILGSRLACRCASGAMQMRLNAAVYRIQLRSKSSSTNKNRALKARRKEIALKKAERKAERAKEPVVPKKKTRDPLQGMREAAKLASIPKQPPKVVEKKPVEKKPVERTIESETAPPSKNEWVKFSLEKEGEVPSTKKETEKTSSIRNEPEKPVERKQAKIPSPTIKPITNSTSNRPSRRSASAPPDPPTSKPLLSRALPFVNFTLIVAGVLILYYSPPAWLSSWLGLEEKAEGEERTHAQQNSFIRQRDIDRTLQLLKEVFGDRFSTDENELSDFGGEGIMDVGNGKKPIAIVWPETTEEIEVILKLANTYGIPIIPYSGGTSLEGYNFI